MMAGRELFPVTKVLYSTVGVLINNLAQERIKNADVDVLVKPELKGLHHFDFDKVDQFVKVGEKAMEKELKLLKKKLR